MLEYGVRAGLIFCLAREFDHRLNSIILEKAIRYRHRGVVGIDLAGTETRALELDADQVGRLRGSLPARPRGRPQDHRAHRRDPGHRAPRG